MPEPPGNGLQLRARAPLLLRWPGMPPATSFTKQGTLSGRARNIFKGPGKKFLAMMLDLTDPIRLDVCFDPNATELPPSAK
jgi:hypothetical protein